MPIRERFAPTAASALAIILVGCAPLGGAWAGQSPQPGPQQQRVAQSASRASMANATEAPQRPPPTPVHLTPAPSVVGNPENGRRLFSSTGCAGCHTIQGVSGANGTTGPVLTNVVLRPTLAGESIPASPDVMMRWLLNPQSVKPGATMPSVGLTAQEAQDLTAFLYAQPYNPR